MNRRSQDASARIAAVHHAPAMRSRIAARSRGRMSVAYEDESPLNRKYPPEEVRCRGLLLLRERVLDGLGSAHDDLEVQLQGVRRDRVPADRLLLPHPVPRCVEADASGQEDTAASRARQVPAHREPVLVAPAGDRELVAREPDVQTIDLLAEFSTYE